MRPLWLTPSTHRSFRHTLRIGLVMVGFILGGCLPSPKRSLSSPLSTGRAAVLFTETTARSGVHVTPALWDTQAWGPYRAITHFAGAALEDLDGDGNLDLVIADTGRVHLFQGNGKGQFIPKPALMLGAPNYNATGIAIGDLDNDGRNDLVVAVANGPLHIFHNDGAWHFSDITTRVGVNVVGAGMSVNLVDYNNDGFLDIFVCRIGMFPKGRSTVILNLEGDPDHSLASERNVLLRNNGNGTFTDVTVQAGLRARDWSFASSWADYDGDGYQDLYVANDFGLSRLYRNNGNGTFTEMTEKMGFIDVGSGMSAMWGDVNNDGRPDLLIGDMLSHTTQRFDREHPDWLAHLPPTIRNLRAQSVTTGNRLLIQQPNGTFVNEAVVRGVSDGGWAWGTIFADFNNDGWPDIYVANGWRRGPAGKSADYCPMMVNNVVHSIDRKLQMVGSVPSLPMGGSTKPSSGHATSQPSSRRLQGVERLWKWFSGSKAAHPSAREIEQLLPFVDEEGNGEVDLKDAPEIGDMSWDGYHAKRLFINPGPQGGPFLEIKDSPVNFDDPGRSVVAGDIDNDGDLDLVVVSTSCPVRIFRNDSPPQHWLEATLEGTRSNRSAIGAQVKLLIGDQIRVQTVTAGAGFNSHQPLRVHFGLGSLTHVDALEVRWPSGIVQRVVHPAINRRLKIREDSAPSNEHTR